VGACVGELDAGTNFEILAERDCEKQQAAEAVIFCFAVLMPGLTGFQPSAR
jgi:hypothetical protein